MLTDEMRDEIRRAAREKALVFVVAMVIELAGIERARLRGAIRTAMRSETAKRPSDKEVWDLYDAAFWARIDGLLRAPA